MQDLLGLGDEQKLRSVAGLAGGIGHRGAACGIMVGGAVVLGLAGMDENLEQEEAVAINSARVREFIRKFGANAGSSLCSKITRTDFDDERQLRKYILARSLGCIKLVATSAPELTDIIARDNDVPDARYQELNRRFSEKNFHCAHSVIVNASERLGVEPPFSPHALIPLNGGLGYSGSTCAALLAGCIVIGNRTGGDTRDNSIFKTFRRMILTLVQGSAAFNRLDLSPANDALLRCARLFDWFEDSFRSHLCREITGVDFEDDAGARDYFEGDIMSKCVSMAEQTAARAAELAG